jgi:acyl-CoA hydrolase/GNAT superfamily N-acetyltransferase
MDVKGAYEKKRMAADEALGRVRPGQRVFVGSGCAEPQTLVRALCKQAERLSDVEVVHLLTLGVADYVDVDYLDSFRHNAFFIGANTRAAVNEGKADYTPIFLSEIPHLIRSGQRRVDVALVMVSPPDKHGLCSFGIHVDIAQAAVETAKLVIAEINPHMPRTFGDSQISLSDIDCIVESHEPILELPPPEHDEISERIGGFVASLVDHGACLQAGIGAIPAAALRGLGHKRDLGVHTEMFTDDMVALIETGAVTNRLKKVHPGRTLTSFVMGTRRLYDFVDDNPSVFFYASDYVNDPRIISQNDKVVSINSALQVDLTGQVCADSMGPRFYSGIGGQVDFVRGAAMSRGGKPIIALPSTAKDGTIHRIVPMLDEGAGVVTSRGDVHYVVTEYGIAYLHGKTIRERALALINIAHPDARGELLSYVKRRHYVHEDERVFLQAVNPYPAQLEHRHAFGDIELCIRPLKATDERTLQEFFYSHEPDTVYNRHMNAKKRLSRQEAAELCCVDYKQTMALGAFLEREGAQTLLGVARYSLDPDTNTAETAVVIHEDYRRRGIASHLMRSLERYAAELGIKGFYSEIMDSNFAALEWRKAQRSPMQWDSSSNIFRVAYDFEGNRRASIPASELTRP